VLGHTLAFLTVAAQAFGGFNRLPVDLVRETDRCDKHIEAFYVSADETGVTIA
jgi:hypothetical protein